MRAIFEFDLPEDQNEFQLMNQARKVQSFLWDFNEQLRSWYKYGHPFKDTDDALHEIREQWYRLMNEHGVDLDL